MAKIITREWTTRGGPTARKVRHLAYGYTLMVNEKRERTVSSAWQTQVEALDALNTRLKEISEGRIERPKDASVSQLKTEYLA